MSLRSFVGRSVHKLHSWFRVTFRRKELEERMDSELAYHFELLTHDLVQSGLSPEEARRGARIALGPMLKHKENMRASLGLRWSDQLQADLRFAIRLLRKSPGFTIVAATSLALAIGANTSIFSITKQLLYDRLDVRQSESLRLLTWTGTKGHVAVHDIWGDRQKLPDGRVTSSAFSYPVYEQLKAETSVLDDLFAFKDAEMNGTIAGTAQRVKTEMVSGNYFDGLGVRPQMGRVLQQSDDATPGQGAVAVISDGLWVREFGRSPLALGQSIKLNDVPFMIVGVSPKGFTGAKSTLDSPDVFLPLAMQPLASPDSWDRSSGPSLLDDPNEWWVNVMGRAKPGVREEQAEAYLDARLAAAVRATMTVRPGEDIPLVDLRDGSRGLFEQDNQYAKPLTALMTLVGFVLLLACANIATLMLARSSRREREMSVRMALGAGRLRVMCQMLVESLLLAVLGGAGGLLAGYVGDQTIPKMLENSWKRGDFQIHFDWRVFVFAAGITLLTGILFGLAPAFAATRANVSHGLKETTQTITRRRKGTGNKALVSFQIALSTLLVIGAGLFLRTMLGLRAVDLGFRSDHLLLVEVVPPSSKYSADKEIALHRKLEEAFASIPAVESLSPATIPYVSDNMSSTDFLPQGEQYDKTRNQAENYNLVGGRFFQTLGVPIVAGRAFGPLDTQESIKVGIINESLARTRFPGQNPIGKFFKTSLNEAHGHASSTTDDRIQIVGICGDTRYMNLRDAPPPQFFLPYVQQSRVSGMTYEIRTGIKPEAILPALRMRMRQIDPDLPLINMRTQAQQIDTDLEQERIFVALTSGFGILALALAAVGIYGVIAYSVAQRTNEIGIRIALGALPSQVRRMILSESGWLAATGSLIGLAMALLMAHLVRSLLYGIEPYDPTTLFVATLLLLTVALLASWIPALRASRVQPMEALRHE